MGATALLAVAAPSAAAEMGRLIGFGTDYAAKWEVERETRATVFSAAPRRSVAQVAPTGGRKAGTGEHSAVAASRAVARLIATDAGARDIAAHALALRAVILKGSGKTVLSRIPGSESQGGSPTLWPAFFGNAMVALGRLRSSRPTALYYNPLLDVAVLTFWEKREDSWRVAAVKALPGERLGGSSSAVPLHPSWLGANRELVAALSAVATSRLEEFHRLHPPEAGSGAGVASSFAADAADARAAWPRLMWNVYEHAGWFSGARGWLKPTLSTITDVLSSGNAAAVTAAAPATDPETAEAVAGLPAGLAAELALDMVLDAGEDRRILIGSLPEDGQVYFLVLCRVDGAACPLRRIAMVSLLDNGEAAAGPAQRKKG